MMPLAFVDTETTGLHQDKQLWDRFWDKVTAESDIGCWEWQAAKDRDGYGRFRTPTSHVGAHRMAFTLARGLIPEGLDIDHLCRNHGCVNPWHLQPVTEQVNTLRGIGPSAVNATKVSCPKGHPLEGDNLYVNPRGGRSCRICLREARRAYEARKVDDNHTAN